jgi:hypothetical protein
MDIDIAPINGKPKVLDITTYNMTPRRMREIIFPIVAPRKSNPEITSFRFAKSHHTKAKTPTNVA